MNQRVIINQNVDTTVEAASWLDSLIGNFINSDEVVTGIIHFQIIPITGDSFLNESDYFDIVVAVTTEIADAPSNSYGDDDPDHSPSYEPWH